MRGKERKKEWDNGKGKKAEAMNHTHTKCQCQRFARRCDALVYMNQLDSLKQRSINFQKMR